MSIELGLAIAALVIAIIGAIFGFLAFIASEPMQTQYGPGFNRFDRDA